MRRGLLYFFLSGVAGLGYEILWTRMFSVSLGHEIVAVLGAFFSSLALGAWLLDRPVSRSARPGLWYMGFELVIGCWALVLTILIPLSNPVVASLIGPEPTPYRHWGIAFLYPFLLLLPATVAMGGTLSAMDRFFCQALAKQRSVGGLYSANTFGAMAGTFLTTFLFMPTFGLRTTSLLLALVMGVEQTGDVVQLYKTVRKPLFKVVRKSIDFSTAYFPLLSIAYDIYPYDREASEQLLLDLERANPMRREAAMLHYKLFKAVN